MAAEGGFFHPTLEVNELRWLSIENATRLLPTPGDRGAGAGVLMAAETR